MGKKKHIVSSIGVIDKFGTHGVYIKHRSKGETTISQIGGTLSSRCGDFYAKDIQ